LSHTAIIDDPVEGSSIVKRAGAIAIKQRYAPGLGNNVDRFRRSAANLVLMDRVMAHYGPETGEPRSLLRRIIVSRLQQMSSANPASGLLPVGSGGGIEELQDLLRARTPRDDAQRWLQSRTLQISGDVSQAQWMLFEQSTGSIQWPFLAILAFWLAVIFTSFGLFAPATERL
jgi:hypothetical protein